MARGIRKLRKDALTGTAGAAQPPTRLRKRRRTALSAAMAAIVAVTLAVCPQVALAGPLEDVGSFLEGVGNSIMTVLAGTDTDADAAATKTETVVDNPTYNGWESSSISSTKNVGRVWTDKSVWDTTAEFEAKNEKGETITTKVEKGQHSDFLVGLSALSSTSNISTTVNQPLDIVLVLDTSGSMDDSMPGAYEETYDLPGLVIWSNYAFKVNNQYYAAKNYGPLGGWHYYDDDGNWISVSKVKENADDEGLQLYKGSSIKKLAALKNSVNQFINLAAEQNKSVSDTSMQHRIGIVSFASSAMVKSQLTYCDEAGKESLTKTVNNLSANGATRADSGMSQASNMLKNARPDAKKVVIFFTDGEPTSGIQFESRVANAATTTAGNLKNNGVSIYSVGVFEDSAINDTKTNMNAFMHAISSNYSAGTSYTQVQNGATRVPDSNFYRPVINTDGLDSVFKDIYDEISSSAGSPLKDVTSGGNQEPGTIDFVDQLGDYMQVDNFNAVLLAGTQYNTVSKTDIGNNTTKYTFEGTVTANSVYKAADLADLTITVTRTPNNEDGTPSRAGDVVKVSIPASLLPMRNFNIDADETTMNVSNAYPIFLFYNVSRKDGVEDLVNNPNQEMADYLSWLRTDSGIKNDDGKVSFQSNYFSNKTSAVHNGTLGTTTATFSPAASNGYYYTSRVSAVYTDQECTQQVTPSQAIANGKNTYYFKNTYYQIKGEGGKATNGKYVEVTEETSFTANFADLQYSDVYTTGADGYLYLKAGQARNTIINEFHIDKNENKTTTATVAIDPQWDNYSAQIVTHLGNNGKIVMDQGQTLSVTKNVEAGVGQTIPESLNDKDFTFTIKLTNDKGADLTGTYKAQVTYEAGKVADKALELSNGSTTFTLKAGETLQVFGLPVGTKYTVTEVKADHFTADKDVQEGAITAPTGDEENPNSLTFTNTYAPDKTSLKTSAQGMINYEKQLVDEGNSFGWTDAASHPFEIRLVGLIQATDTPDGITFDTMPLPEGEREATQGTTANVAAGNPYVKVTIASEDDLKGSFDDIWFDKPGTYTYNVYEKTPDDANAIPGLDYSNALFRVVVKVVDNNGMLAVDNITTHRIANTSGETLETPESFDNNTATFKNVYDPAKANFTVTGVKTVRAFNEKDFDAHKAFTFQVRPVSADGTPLMKEDGTLDSAARELAFQNETTGVISPIPVEKGWWQVQNTGEGTILMGRATFEEGDAGKSFYYQIQEATDDNQPGYGYDTNTTRYLKISVDKTTKAAGETVVVPTATYYMSLDEMKDDKNGATSFSFTNTYNATAAKTTLTIQKSLTGRTWGADESATFNVSYTGYVGSYTKPTIANQSVVVEQSKDDPKQSNSASTEEIKFTRPGTYTFTISEARAQWNMNPVTKWDEHEATATVVVTDKGTGQLEVESVIYTNADAPSAEDAKATNKAAFTNAYTGHYTTGDGLVTLEKTLTGRTMGAGEFTFEVKAAGEGDEAVAAAAKKLGGDTKVYTNVATTSENQKSTNKLFDGMTFTQDDLGSSFTYTVSEQQGATDKGVTYDPTVYTVTLTPAIGDDGQLTVNVSIKKGDEVIQGNTVAFANTYGTTPVEYESTDDLTKVLSGRDWADGESFSFTVTPQNGAPLPEGVTLNDDGAATVTVSNSEAGHKSGEQVNFGLGKITFTAKGTYTYKVNEVIPGDEDKLGGMTYDNHEAIVTFTVTDNGDGTLEVAEPAVSSGYFYNSYSPDSIKLTDVVELSATKTLNGRTLTDGQFEFSISDPSQQPSFETVKNDAKGNIDLSFIEKTYTKDDDGRTFVYTVKEVVPKDVNPGITYDTAEHKIEVTPHDNLDGTMSLDVTYDGEKVGGENNDKIYIEFTNSYEANTADSLELSATKKYEGGTLKGDDFEFVLKDQDGKQVATAKNDAQGNVKFGELKFTTADAKKGYISVKDAKDNGDGTYTFDWIMSETTESADGRMAVSPVTYDVTVTVKDEGNGTLTATANVPEGGYTFTNFSPEKTVKVGEQSVDGSTAYVGQELTYTISYFNNTDQNQTITITDMMPYGTEYVAESASENADVCEDGSIKWTINDVKSGEGGTVSFKVKVTQVALDETVKNAATVRIGENDPKVEVKTNTTSVSVPTGSLKVTKVVAGDNADPNAEYEMKVTLKDVNGDVLSGEFGGVQFDVNGETTFMLKKDGSKTIEGLPAGATYKVEETTAIAGWEADITNNGVGTITADKEDAVTVTNTAPNAVTTTLDVNKAIQGRDWKVDDSFKFELKDSNNEVAGTATVNASSTDHKASFPALSFSAAGEYVYTVTEVAPTGDDRDGRMEYSGAEYKVKVTVDGVEGGGLEVSSVQYSADGGNTWVDKNNMTFTNVYTPEAPQPKKDVALATDVTKASVNGKLVGVGDELVYTIDWTNDAVDKDGKATAATVTVTDKLSEGLEFVSADNDGKLENGVIKWVINADAGKSGTVSFKAKVSDKALTTDDDSITNTATVQVGKNDPKQSTKATVYVPQKHQLVDGEPVVPASNIQVGDLITYKIDWRNDEETAADVVVTDKVPTGTKFDSINDEGKYNEEDGTVSWTIKDAAAGTTGTVSFTVRVTEAALTNRVKNQAQVKIGERETQIKTNTETLPELKTGSVKVTKKVTATEGLTAPGTATFTLKLTMTDAAGIDLTGSYGYKVYNANGDEAGSPAINFLAGILNALTGSEGPTISNNGTVQLTAGQYVVVEGLPEGAQVSVTEPTMPKGFSKKTLDKDLVATIAAGKPGDEGQASLTVENVYSVTSKVYDVATDLKVSKTLTGRDGFEGEQFTIAMTPLNGAPAPTNTEVKLAAPTNGETTFSTAKNGFGTITFDTVGRYRYELREVVPEVPELGMSYSDAVYTVEYEVVSDGEGGLLVIVHFNDGAELVDGALNFTNTLNTGSLTVKKTVEAGESGVDVSKLDDVFSFTATFTAPEGTTLNGIYGGVTFKEGKATDTFTLTNGEEKEYSGLPEGVTYTVSETAKEGFTLTAIDGKKVEGEQKAADGTITANASTVVFTNTFTPGDAEFDPTQADVLVEKHLIDGGDLEAGRFTFTMTVTDDKKNEVARQEQVGNGVKGEVNFKKLTFSKTGKYTVSVTEDVPTDRGNIYYDEHEFTYQIEVTRDGGKLVANVVPSSIKDKTDRVFTNIQGYKIVSGVSDEGIKLGDVLTYTISWANVTGGNAKVVITDELPEGLSFVSATPEDAKVTIDGQKVTIDLGEQANDAMDVVTIKVRVNEKAFGKNGVTNGATVEIGNKSKVTLTSNPVEPKTGSLTVSKTVETKNGAAVDNIKVFDIDVTLTNPDDSPLTGTYKVGDKDVTVDKDGKLTLELTDGQSATIEGIPAGAKYTVSELAPYGYTFSATNDGKGTISDAEATVSVTNTYAPGPAEFDPVAVTKVLTDGELAADQFTFDLTVTDDNDNDNSKVVSTQTATNDKDGKVTFKSLTFDKAGTYTVTVKEQLPEEHGSEDRGSVYYDEHEFSYKINVFSNGSDKFQAELDQDPDSVTGKPVFKNVQGKKTVTGVPDTGIKLGDELTYTITWANTTGEAAKVTITDKLPEGLTYVSATPEDKVAVNNQTVTWNLGEQQAGASGSVTVTARVNEQALSVDEVTNKATIEVGDNPDVTVTSDPVNKPDTGELEVSKNVVGGDTNKYFKFNVTLKDGEAPLTGTYHYTDAEGKTREFTGGTATLKLKHGQCATFTDLPQGVSYAVAEDEDGAPGYTATATGDTGKIGADESRAVFTNTYGEDVTPVECDTTMFTKVFEGCEWKTEDEFEFTITGVDENGNALSDELMPEKTSVKVNGEGATKADGSESYSKDFDFGAITYKLSVLDGATWENGIRWRTFTYTVKETKGDIAGVTYDEHEATFTVTLSDDGAGNLSTTTAVAAAVVSNGTFTNTFSSSVDYTMAKSGINISKVLTGRDMTEDQFEWTVEFADGPEDLLGIDGQVVESVAARNGKVATMPVSFEDVKITSADALANKSWTYTVNETKHGGAGYTNDLTVYTVSIVPTLDVSTGVLTVTTTVRDDAGQVMDEHKVYSTNEAAEGETTGHIAGVSVPFVNSYEATPATLAIKATKQLINRPLTDGEFRFAVTNDLEESEAPTILAEGTNNAKGDITFSGITYTTDRLEADFGAGLAMCVVNGDSYTYIYQYNVSEYEPSKDGVDAKTGAQRVTVEVTDAGDGGELDIKVTYPESSDGEPTDHLTFVNKYGDTAEDSVAVTGVKTLDYASDELRENAKLTQKDIAEKFEFTVKGVDENGDELPAELMPEKTTVKNDATGTVNFGEIKFTMSNVFGDTGDKEATEPEEPKTDETGSVTGGEQGGATGETGKTEQPEVPEQGGTEVEKPETSEPGKDETEQPVEPAEPAAPANGDVVSDEPPAAPEGDTDVTDVAAPLSNELVADDVTPGEASAAAFKSAAFDGLKRAVAFGQQGLIRTAADGDGEPEVSKPETGKRTRTFTYTVTEKGSVDGVTNDAAAEKGKTFTVTVTDNGDGTISTMVGTYTTGAEGATAARAFEFVNVYDVKSVDSTPTGEGALSITKKLNAAEGTTRTLAEGEFTFALIERDSDGVEWVRSTGTNAADGTVKFDAVTFDNTDLGTHTYEIRELVGTAGGVKYDGRVLKATAIVTDNGHGGLDVTWSSEGSLEFVNEYSVTGASITFRANKTLVGRTLSDGEFEFELREGDRVLQTVKNAADGSVTFAPIEFTGVGEHTYVISEVAGSDKNVTYDDAKIEYHVVVTDNGKGGLDVDWTCSSEKGAAFVNVYTEPVVPEPDPAPEPEPAVPTEPEKPAPDKVPVVGDATGYGWVAAGAAGAVAVAAAVTLGRKRGHGRKE